MRVCSYVHFLGSWSPIAKGALILASVNHGSGNRFGLYSWPMAMQAGMSSFESSPSIGVHDLAASGGFRASSCSWSQNKLCKVILSPPQIGFWYLLLVFPLITEILPSVCMGSYPPPDSGTNVEWFSCVVLWPNKFLLRCSNRLCICLNNGRHSCHTQFSFPPEWSRLNKWKPFQDFHFLESRQFRYQSPTL